MVLNFSVGYSPFQLVYGGEDGILTTINVTLPSHKFIIDMRSNEIKKNNTAPQISVREKKQRLLKLRLLSLVYWKKKL